MTSNAAIMMRLFCCITFARLDPLVVVSTTGVCAGFCWIMRVAVADWTLPAEVPVTVSVYAPGLAVEFDRSRLSVDVYGGIADWVVKLLRTSPGQPITVNETGAGVPDTATTDTT
jgi:hypothetical protein